MYFSDEQIRTLFSLCLLGRTAGRDKASLLRLNTFTSILVQNSIPFDVSYTSGNRKDPQEIELSIHINPKTTVAVKMSLN